jgi:hypothetical protein
MEKRKIVKIRQIDTQPVYDIEVADAHHYVLGNGVVCHNSGLTYVSDSIAMLSKTKVRDKEKHIIGNDVTIKMYKSRLSRENNEVDVRILYTGGLDRHYGLLELAEAAGMITVVAGRYTFPGQAKSFTAAKIAETPETFFTPEFLQSLDETFVKPNFSYGQILVPSPTRGTTDHE